RKRPDAAALGELAQRQAADGAERGDGAVEGQLAPARAREIFGLAHRRNFAQQFSRLVAPRRAAAQDELAAPGYALPARCRPADHRAEDALGADQLRRALLG